LDETEIAVAREERMTDTDPAGDAASRQSAMRKRALQMALAAFLFLPVPALAANLVIGNWNYIVYQGTNPGQPWTTNSTGNSLTFQGAGGSIGAGGDTIIVMYAPLVSKSNNISAVTSNFQTLKTTKGSVSVSIAFADVNVNTITYIYGPNMFSGQLPPSLGPISRPIPANAFYVAVAFDFSGSGTGTTWTTQSSSPFQVNFSGF
jgi:hypothetical protein